MNVQKLKKVISEKIERAQVEILILYKRKKKVVENRGKIIGLVVGYAVSIS